MSEELTPAVRSVLLQLQKTEITEHHVYARLAERVKVGANRELLQRIAADERRHYEEWQRYTGQELPPTRWRVYVVTVALLILPCLVLADYFACLAWTLGTALLIIAAFNYYVAVAKDRPFGRRFFEMAGVSLGVAALSFGIGILVRKLLGVEL
jgi:VIT1/CCC1 family predicted Fe2+/Mn2+ transporter